MSAPGPSSRRPSTLDNPGVITGVQGLVIWSMAHIWYALVVSLLPPNNSLIYQMYKFLGISMLACLLVTFSKLKVPFRLTVPVAFLMLLQVWFVYCDFDASLTLGRYSPFGLPNFVFLFYVFFFVQAAALVYFAPQVRKLFVTMLLCSIAASAFVAVLQFAKVGPALSLGNYYNAVQDISNWDKRGGVRAVGLQGWPALMALVSLGGFVLIGARMLTRKLKAWELVACIALLAIAFMAQSRTLYPGTFLAMIAFVWMLSKRDKPKALIFVMLMTALSAIVFTLAYDRIAYALTTNVSEDPNLRFRLNVGWPQAYHIFAARPWTGIGPDLNLVFISPTTEPDQWVSGQTLDNGYLMLLAWGGLPAIGIFLMAAGTGIWSLFKIVRKADIAPERRQTAFFAAAMLLGLLNYMFGGVGFVDTPFLMMLVLTAAGLSMPSREEAMTEVRRPMAI